MARERPPVISIVGLGPLGVAMGRALAAVRTDFRLVGHDRAPERVRSAVAAGAIDDGRWNLIAAVDDADLVILAEPLAQALETLAVIGPHLRPGSLVTDTAPVMRPLLRAAADLPPGVSYVSGHPVLSGSLTDAAPDAVDAAAAAVSSTPASTAAAAPAPATSAAAGPFTGIVYCVVPAAGADAEAVRVLVDLIGAIGAEPYFIDADEHDALVAAVDQLPHLAGAALARVLGLSPSSDDLARLVPRRMRATWLAAGRGGDDAADAAVADRVAVLAWLDGLLRELGELRGRVASGDAAAVGAWLTEAEAARGRLAPPQAPRPGDAAAWQDVGPSNPLRALLLGQRKGRPR